jgi:peroxiredoxin Q/BCP
MLTALALLLPSQAVDLKVGDAAPKFEAPDDAGNAWKSESVVGKKIVVVYFYPASFTGGCTKQACAFRDDAKPLTDKDVVVIGVSGDTVKTQALFKKEHNLNFTLLADEKGEVAKAFGVPTRPGGKGKVKIGGQDTEVERSGLPARWTFILGKDGKVAFKNKEVKAAEDSKAVLEAVEKLK